MNKIIRLLIVVTITTILGTAKGQNIYVDERDNQNYNIVQIGDLIWFAENLNYNSSDSECYESNPANCEKYGRLYTYYESEEVCPVNWRLPAKKDIKNLRQAMKSKTFESIINKEDWKTKEADIGTNTLGLSIKPGGRKFDEEKGLPPWIKSENVFFGIGISASFWMGGEKQKNPRHWHINHFGGSQKMKVHKHGKPSKGAKLSILCVKHMSK